MSRGPILVTGSQGLLGRHVIACLQEQQLEVVEHRGRTDGDLSDPDYVRELIRDTQPGSVINAAGASYGSPPELWTANTVVPIRLAEALREQTGGAGRLVILSSAAVYGLSTVPGTVFSESDPCRPNSDYGLSKAAAESLSTVLHGNVAIARVFNIFTDEHDATGARSLLARVREAFQSDDILPAGAFDVRDWVTPAEVGSALALLAVVPEAPGTVNVCTGHGRSPAHVLGFEDQAAPKSWSIGDPRRLETLRGCAGHLGSAHLGGPGSRDAGGGLT